MRAGARGFLMEIYLFIYLCLFLLFLVHVLRRDEEYVGKMLEMEPPGGRRRGRQNRRYIDAAKENNYEGDGCY